jgi:hypothetical protein
MIASGLVTSLTCPHCGEPAETFVDPGGGELQDYVEDCVICCRPIRFVVRYDEKRGEYTVVAAREGD